MHPPAPPMCWQAKKGSSHFQEGLLLVNKQTQIYKTNKQKSPHIEITAFSAHFGQFLGVHKKPWIISGGAGGTWTQWHLSKKDKFWALFWKCLLHHSHFISGNMYDVGDTYRDCYNNIIYFPVSGRGKIQHTNPSYKLLACRLSFDW